MLYGKPDRLARRVSLAWRSILRQRGRSLMTLVAIAFGVASLVFAGGFVQDVYVQLAEALIRSKTGHLQVARAGFFTYGSRSPERYVLLETRADRLAIESLPEVAEVMASSRTGRRGSVPMSPSLPAGN
jgi:putative ABC transport system permease protein